MEGQSQAIQRPPPHVSLRNSVVIYFSDLETRCRRFSIDATVAVFPKLDPFVIRNILFFFFEMQCLCLIFQTFAKGAARASGKRGLQKQKVLFVARAVSNARTRFFSL